MNNEEIVLGQKYACKPIGLKHTVVGEVINKLENCIVLCVEKYQECDNEEILEKCGKVVAKYSDVYNLKEAEAIFEHPSKIYEPVLVS
ncbi:MAG: hypothetical protein IC227_07875 [Enterococcus lacertideformus]|uniref:Uncharacterized protein n=1 Tax=Enterococcus lacertideformus TaxID=2771493 RepID=A0A931AYR7_9ENTE|nr:hypothetical protein [Enterococcus lacertideformus]